MAKPSAFSGVKLTEQTPLKTPGLDQRLFSSSPAQTPTDQTEETREVGKEGSRERGKETSLPGNRSVGQSFDINQKPYRKDSFLFTAEEFESLEDLKLELRRKFDLRATKNDIARCAIHTLIEDYHRRGGDSTIVRRLGKKTTR